MSKITADIARLPLLLHELRLPAISRLWQDIATRADKEGWPATRFLAALAEFEIAERAKRRIERHLAEARLPPGCSAACVGSRVTGVFGGGWRY